MIASLLSILLEHTAHPIDADSVTFTAMQVGTIIGLAVSIAGVFFANKAAISQLQKDKKTLQMVAEKENDARKKEIEKVETIMNRRVDEAKRLIEKLQGNLGNKMEGVTTKITDLEVKIGENHSALLQALLTKGNNE